MQRYNVVVIGAAILYVAPLFGQEDVARNRLDDNPPKTARLRIGSTRFRETASVRDIEFLPDGKHLVTSKGPLVRYWSLETGFLVNEHTFKPEAKLAGTGTQSSKAFRTNAISPDGKKMAVLVRNDVFVAPIDLMKTPAYEKWSPPRRTSAKYVALDFVRIGDDELIATLDESGAVALLTRQPGAPKSLGANAAKPVFFKVAGTKCVVASLNGIFSIVELKTMKRITQKFEDSIQSIAMSADDKFLAIHCNEKELLIWDLEANKEKARHKVDPNAMTVAIAPGGQRVLSHRKDSRTTELRDLDKDKPIAVEKTGVMFRADYQFSRDGKFCVALQAPGLIYLWDARTGKLLTPAGNFGEVTALHWLRAGDLLSASKDATTRRWDTRTGKEKTRIEDAVGIRRWIFNKDETTAYVQSNNNGAIRARDLTNDKVRVVAALPEASPFGRFFSGMALSLDEKVIAFAEGNSIEGIVIRLQELATGKSVELKVASDPDGLTFISDLLFASDKLLLAKSGRADVSVWDLKKKEVVRTFKADDNRYFIGDTFRSMVLTPDRRQLVGRDVLEAGKFSVKNPPVIAFWDIETGKRVKHFTIDTPPTAIAMSADGKTILTGDQKGAVHVWDVASTNRILHEPNAHRGAVTAIAIAPDGRSFATGSADTSILVWDMPKGK